ncbi:LapA family protein [Stenoxybacter acetivorans]|uniref:LapA family protein n=1 Tax=Stenoxybacter acetivorans TaxID=422441 RepID=UPI000A02C558|nr:LapA family protein [Stenoxybacter acetivorans]
MKIIYTLIKLLILIAFILLAVSNTQNTAFHYLPDQGFELPLIVLMLIFFVLGAVVGVFSMFGRLLSLRGEVNRLKREAKKQSKELSNTAANQSDTAISTVPVAAVNQTEG